MRSNPISREDGRLYAAIARAGFSIGGFARRMAVSRITVWRIDRSLQEPTAEWYARAAELLGVRVEDIAPEVEVAA